VHVGHLSYDETKSVDEGLSLVLAIE